MEPISIKIDVTKLKKDAFYRGEKGTYVTLTVWPTKDGMPDQYGNDASVKQDLGKDRRDEPSVFVGSAKIIRRKTAAPQPQQKPPGAKTLYEEMQDDSEIPF
jgi:hypothetical protein